MKRVGNAYVQKGNGFEKILIVRGEREREKHASDPCPNKVNQSNQMSPPGFHRRMTALGTIRFGLNLRPRTGADRRVEVARRTSGIARIDLAMRR